MKMSKEILSPKNDFIFKLIFGDQRNADVLASFLQAVLDLPKSEYEELSIVDPHLKRESADDKLSVLDVKIHTKSGKVVEVEIQILETPQMRERIVYYAGKMITEQISRGEDYGAIKRVISIVITDYELIKENRKYHNRYRLYDKESGSEFTDILEVNTLELPKVPKRDDRTELFDWLLFLKSEGGEELEMLAKKNPQIKKA
ncbi:MAG: Rpn family recombination-promoting nuclease/putative transposase, partial [Acidaminococcales bacterium]|nr:Rpn family recombination-promoting nuclease/putative transposase [Acidaminococcales bacterium]